MIPARLRLELEGFARGDAAPPIGDGAALLDGGGGLRLVLRRGRWGGSAGLSATKTLGVEATAGTYQGSYDQVRLVGDIGGRFGGHLGFWPLAEFFVDAGLVLGGHWTSAEGFYMARGASAFDIGLRVGAVLRIRVAPRASLLVGLDAIVLPASHPLNVGDTKVGQTPYLWLGLTLGVAVPIL